MKFYDGLILRRSLIIGALPLFVACGGDGTGSGNGHQDNSPPLSPSNPPSQNLKVNLDDKLVLPTPALKDQTYTLTGSAEATTTGAQIDYQWAIPKEFEKQGVRITAQQKGQALLSVPVSYYAAPMPIPVTLNAVDLSAGARGSATQQVLFEQPLLNVQVPQENVVNIPVSLFATSEFPGNLHQYFDIFLKIIPPDNKIRYAGQTEATDTYTFIPHEEGAYSVQASLVSKDGSFQTIVRNEVLEVQSNPMGIYFTGKNIIPPRNEAFDYEITAAYDSEQHAIVENGYLWSPYSENAQVLRITSSAKDPKKAVISFPKGAEEALYWFKLTLTDKNQKQASAVKSLQIFRPSLSIQVEPQINRDQGSIFQAKTQKFAAEHGEYDQVEWQVTNQESKKVETIAQHALNTNGVSLFIFTPSTLGKYKVSAVLKSSDSQSKLPDIQAKEVEFTVVEPVVTVNIDNENFEELLVSKQAAVQNSVYPLLGEAQSQESQQELTYEWSIVGANTANITIEKPHLAKTNFVVPQLYDEDTEVIFRLKASDRQGKVGYKHLIVLLRRPKIQAHYTEHAATETAEGYFEITFGIPEFLRTAFKNIYFELRDKTGMQNNQMFEKYLDINPDQEMVKFIGPLPKIGQEPYVYLHTRVLNLGNGTQPWAPTSYVLTRLDLLNNTLSEIEGERY